MALCPGYPGEQYKKVKPIWILLKQKTVNEPVSVAQRARAVGAAVQ